MIDLSLLYYNNNESIPFFVQIKHSGIV